MKLVFLVNLVAWRLLADTTKQTTPGTEAYWAGVFVPALFTEKIYTPKMSEENGAAVGAETIRRSVCISADPEKHISNARRYIDLGFNHLIFHSAGPDQSQFVRDYGQRVLPALRQKKSTG